MIVKLEDLSVAVFAEATTLRKATKRRPVIVLPGEGRAYEKGDYAFLFKRPVWLDGSPRELPMELTGWPVIYRNGKWVTGYGPCGKLRLSINAKVTVITAVYPGTTQGKF